MALVRPLPADPLIGLLLPSREVVLWSDGDIGRVVDSGRSAEQSGYDSVWTGDSLLARPRAEPFTLLAAVAAVTDRVSIGTAVLLPLLRHPLNLAHSSASLDRISRGRLILGVGPGAEIPATYNELSALGVPVDNRVTAMLRSIEMSRRLWRSDEPSIKLLPSPHRASGPPVWLGAHGPRLLRRTGIEFDGWLPLSGTPDDYADRWRTVCEAIEQSGRDPDSVTPAMYLTVAIGDNARQSAGELDEYMRAYYGLPAEVMARTQACHAGTLESATEWISTYVAAGARHVILRLARPTLQGYDDAAARLINAIRLA